MPTTTNRCILCGKPAASRRKLRGLGTVDLCVGDAIRRDADVALARAHAIPAAVALDGAALHARLVADADAYHRGALGYDAHHAANRATWDAVEAAGLRDEVSALLRSDFAGAPAMVAKGAR